MEDYTTSNTDHTVNDWASLVPDSLANGPGAEAEKSPAVEAPEQKPEVQNTESQNAENQMSEPERLLQRANLYRKFGKVALALAAIEKARGEKSAAEFLSGGLAQEETTPVEASVSGKEIKENVGIQSAEKFNQKKKEAAKLDADEKDAEEFIGKSDKKSETAEKEKSPEDRQAEALLNQLRLALGDVDKSLENQIKYNIVYHKQINTKEALLEELQKGTGIPELDIRFDKDGTPWISHSPRAGGRFWFSRFFGKNAKPIHKMSTEEMKQNGSRLSLEEGLEILAEYAKDNPNHFPVLELKELGPSVETHHPYLASVKKMLEKNGFDKKTIFATLSPPILCATHDVFPDNPKILNGGIAPVISYNLGENSKKEKSGKKFRFKIPGVELIFSNAKKIEQQPDGYGKQTGYLWSRLPEETVKILQESREKTGIGAASLTVVNKFADVLQIFSSRAAEAVRRHYRGEVEKLDLDIQAQISKKNMEKSARDVLHQMGEGTIIYSNKSHDWSGFDPDEEDEKKTA